MGELGLMGMLVPEEWGGDGCRHGRLRLAVEELARIDSSVGVTLDAHASLGPMAMYNWGTEEQKDGGCPTSAPATTSPRSA